MKTTNAMLLLALASIAPGLQAEDFVEWVGASSGVNWSAAQIESEGGGVGPANAPPSQARLMACRAAVLDGQRNLLESIQGVRVEGTTVVANMMVDSDTIKTTVSGVLRGARVVKREPQPDGSCIVKMTAPMAGQLAKAVYKETLPANATGLLNRTPLRGNNPADISPLQDVPVLALLRKGLGWAIPGAHAQTLSQPDLRDAIDSLSGRLSALEELISSHPAIIEASDAGPTGLVLDARGSNFIPSMTPRLRELRAGVLYPDASHAAARSERGQLVSLFTRDLDTARRHPVVGERPMVLKAMRTFGDSRTEIVIDKDASASLKELIKGGFLADSGVIIVL